MTLEAQVKRHGVELNGEIVPDSFGWTRAQKFQDTSREQTDSMGKELSPTKLNLGQSVVRRYRVAEEAGVEHLL